MASIITKPTDTTSPSYQADLDTFNAQVQEIRDLISPDIRVVITEELLPEQRIIPYIRRASYKVLKDVGISITDLNDLDKTSERYLQLVDLQEIVTAIGLIPQAAQTIRTSFVQQSLQHAEIDWEKRIEELEENYEDLIEIVNPDAETIGDVIVRTTMTQRDY